MAYQLLTVPSARKALRRLPTDIRQHVIEASQPIAQNPLLGEKLHSPFAFLRSFHAKYNNIDYRVVYEIDQRNQAIVVHYAATRENFYKELRKLRIKPS